MKSLAEHLHRTIGRRQSHLTALLLVLAALGLTWLLWPVMEPNPLVFFLLAVAIISWYGGLWPAMSAMAGSLVALYFILLDPQEGWLISGFDGSRLLLFAGVSLVLAWFSERRHKAERLLERSDETFRHLFQAASEAIVIADEHGRITSVNDQAQAIFGYKAEELLGQPVEMLVPSQFRDKHVEHRHQYMADPRTRRMGSNLDLLARHKRGHDFPVEISLSHVHHGQTRRVMALITDITERKQAQQALAEYQQRLRDLAYESLRSEERERRRIAADLHDRIGQALALCQIKLGTLRQQLQKRDQQTVEECIRLVNQSVDDTRDLTFELSPPILYDLGFHAAVHWLAEQLQQEHGLDVAVQSDEADIRLEDETAALFFRTVRELLINVVKHSQTSRARVHIAVNDETLQLIVEDQGVGFDTATLEQPDAGRPRFGLFSIREQLQRIGARIDIRSTPGQGTCVQIHAPIQPASQPADMEQTR